MRETYTAQYLDAGLGRSGNRRDGILVCRVDAPDQAYGLLSYHSGYPVQLLEGKFWDELFKRYPRNQVIRLPDVSVTYSELAHYRKWEKQRQQE